MAQFYLLSVVTNIVASLTLAGDYFAQKLPLLSSARHLRDSRTANIAVGVTAALVGFIKLFVVAPGETVLIAGDLLPAVTGMVLGAVLLAGVFQRPRQEEEVKTFSVSKAITTYRVPLAFVGIAVSILHFLVPSAPLL